MRHAALVGLLLIASLMLALPAMAEKRVALVIGNDGYTGSEAKLKNAANDARLVASALSQAKFQTIDARTDLGIADFRQALRSFQAAASGAEVGLIYYAGHGMEAHGGNWLIPTDAVLNAEGDLDYEAISLELALKALSGAKLRILVLDACRNNPFGRGWRAGARSVARGLKALETDDVLVLYAAAPGQTASDGRGVNSPFASAFAKRLPEPGLPVQLLGGRVRDDVLGATGGTQRPYVSASITGEPFYLLPAAPASRPPLPPAQVPAQQSAAAEAWAHAKDSRSIGELEAFVRRFGDTYFGDLAKTRLDELRRTAEQQRVSPEQREKAAALDRHRAEAAQKQAEEEAAAKKRVEREARRDPIAVLAPGSGQFTRDRLANGQPCPICPEMVVAPSGHFTMGSPASEAQREIWQSGTEGPQLQVTINRPIAVARFAVTRAEFDAFVKESGHTSDGTCNTPTGSQSKRPPAEVSRHPVVCVTWNDAKAYVSWLSRKTGKSYRLLSDAEREYVTRAGTTTAYWWGALISPSQANYGGNDSTDERRRLVPVDSNAANPWGLYNVHGNVWEWTEDCWSESHKGHPGNGSARTDGDCSRRVERGGSWSDQAGYLRAAVRIGLSASASYSNLGFRVARMLDK